MEIKKSVRMAAIGAVVMLLVFSCGVVFGFSLRAHTAVPDRAYADGIFQAGTTARGDTYSPGIVQTGQAGLVVKNNENPARVDFVFEEPIAPQFFVGYGSIGGAYEIFLDKPEWDTRNIGVDKALTLMDKILQEVEGITTDIYAEEYELSVTIAESHLTRRNDVINEILAIIAEEQEQNIQA